MNGIPYYLIEYRRVLLMSEKPKNNKKQKKEHPKPEHDESESNQDLYDCQDVENSDDEKDKLMVHVDTPGNILTGVSDDEAANEAAPMISNVTVTKGKSAKSKGDNSIDYEAVDTENAGVGKKQPLQKAASVVNLTVTDYEDALPQTVGKCSNCTGSIFTYDEYCPMCNAINPSYQAEDSNGDDDAVLPDAALPDTNGKCSKCRCPRSRCRCKCVILSSPLFFFS